MRVKLLLALAIASVLLIGAIGVAAATTTPTAADLTYAADKDISSFGFPDLGVSDTVVSGVPTTDDVMVDALTPTIKKESPDVTGLIPDSRVKETATNIPGPIVGLNSPTVNVFSVPVCISTPEIFPEFAPILLAPEVDLGLPKVNLELNAFDINPAIIDP